jgi:hypothetical protein
MAILAEIDMVVGVGEGGARGDGLNENKMLFTLVLKYQRRQ